MSTPESYNEFRQRGTPDFPLEFFHLDDQHPQYQMPYHWHYECELIRILRGQFDVTLENTSYSAKSGDVLFVNSGTVHGGTPTDCTYECIVFDMNMLLRRDRMFMRGLQQIADREILVDRILPQDDLPLCRTVEMLFDAAAQSDAAAQLSVFGALYQFFGLILQKGYCTASSTDIKSAHKRSAQIKRVLSKMQESYGEPLTLDELSREAGMSPKYFCQFFQEMTHHTPIDYLNYYRIEQAAAQLLQGEASVTEVAYRCGFNDLSYFIRIFKRYKGTTPGKYEKYIHSNR